MKTKQLILILVALVIFLVLLYLAATPSRRKSAGGGEGAYSGSYAAPNPFPDMRQVQVSGAVTSTKTDYGSNEEPTIKIDLNKLR